MDDYRTVLDVHRRLNCVVGEAMTVALLIALALVLIPIAFMVTDAP